MQQHAYGSDSFDNNPMPANLLRRTWSRQRFWTAFAFYMAASAILAPAISVWLAGTLASQERSSAIPGLVGFYRAVLFMVVALLAAFSVVISWRSAKSNPSKHGSALRRFSWKAIPIFFVGAAIFLWALNQLADSFGYFGFPSLDDMGTNLLLMFYQPGIRIYWLITRDPVPMDFGYGLLGIIFVNVLYALILGILANFLYCWFVRLRRQSELRRGNGAAA